MEETIEFRTDLAGVDWARLRVALIADDFDNGRTPEQLRRSFENSYVTVLAIDRGEVIGTVRALSDGVCNAYVVDVWTQSAYRRQGVARQMMTLLMERLPGQHVHLFTDEAVEFYRKLGFKPDGTGLGLVVGEWLKGAG
jgi:ribosomal protein S18 acetylase RimI-like enzyme